MGADASAAGNQADPVDPPKKKKLKLKHKPDAAAAPADAAAPEADAQDAQMEDAAEPPDASAVAAENNEAAGRTQRSAAKDVSYEERKENTGKGRLKVAEVR